MCFLCLVFGGVSHSKEESRIALVIGNGTYKTGELVNPPNDAEDMAALLSKLGFEVIKLKNVNLRKMVISINEFGKRLRRHDVGLFYFAGHGVQIKGQNYLIPVDAEITNEAEVEFEALNAGRVLAQMGDAGNLTNILILDACRDNPYARNFRQAYRGLSRMDAPKGSIIAFATAPGSVAAEGNERNGVYTGFLLKHIISPGLTIEEVFKNTRRDVAAKTNDKQIPWESSSLMRDFYFFKKTPEPVAKKGEVQSEKLLKEKVVSDAETVSEEMQQRKQPQPKVKSRKSKYIWSGLGAAVVIGGAAALIGGGGGGPRPDPVVIEERVQVAGTNSQWTDTGLNLQSGDNLAITATGRTYPGPGHPDEGYDASGINRPADNSNPRPGLNKFALIARIDGEPPFWVGVNFRRTMSQRQNGLLYLIYNDSNYSDNTGAFTATIRIERN